MTREQITRLLTLVDQLASLIAEQLRGSVAEERAEMLAKESMALLNEWQEGEGE